MVHEVEYIGKLTAAQFEDLKKFLTTHGTFKKEKKRLSLLYFRNAIPADLNDIADEQVDLRLRITNKKPELILKYGTFTATHARKEITIPIQDMEPYAELLSCLGWHHVVLHVTHTLAYMYKDIELSLVDVKDFGHTFEAEILSDESGIDDAKKKIDTLLRELHLVPYDQKGIFDQCNLLNNKKELQFDTLKQPFSEIKKRYSDFF